MTPTGHVQRERCAEISRRWGGLSESSGIETDRAEPSEIPSHGHDARDGFAVTVHGLRVEAVAIGPAAAE